MENRNSRKEQVLTLNSARLRVEFYFVPTLRKEVLTFLKLTGLSNTILQMILMIISTASVELAEVKKVEGKL